MGRTSKDLARLMRVKAEADLHNASILMLNGGSLDGVCFLLQQAAEKALKALLSDAGAEFPFTHSLNRLAALALPAHPFLDSYAVLLSALSEYAVAPRYEEIEIEAARVEYWFSRTKEFIEAVGGRMAD